MSIPELTAPEAHERLEDFHALDLVPSAFRRWPAVL